ncbi:hypothetical protein [Actinokineospora inagensis]|uniref:hypothetical protein n=1 Tax=Actinokineospora inagensis TaxID=103730 RepID=UPI000415AB5A|nr:hypothetical protein [Actinokineospora inagensis]
MSALGLAARRALSVAAWVHFVLELERQQGTLPADVTLRVLVFEDGRLVVAIGGLADEFLVGPGTPVLEAETFVEPRRMTVAAKAVYDAAWHAVHAMSPYDKHNPSQVWLLPRMQSVLTDARWPEGVIRVNEGERCDHA